MAGGRQQHQGESQEPARLHSGAGSPLNSIYLLFVHLPSRNNVHFEPSGENSNLYVYAVGDKTLAEAALSGRHLHVSNPGPGVAIHNALGHNRLPLAIELVIGVFFVVRIVTDEGNS